MKIKPTQWLPTILVFLIILLASLDTQGKLIPQRDPRAGVLDASLVAIVKQQTKDQFQIEEVFLGESNPEDIIQLSGFRLFTYQNYGPDIVEPISPDTRILLFLQHKKDDMNAWEVTAYGYCFFWVHNLDKVNDLRKMATDTVALRKSWEAARDIPDGRMRVEALWPYLWNNDRYFQRQTKAELEKTESVAGDYIAQQFELMDFGQHATLVRDLGKYGSSYAHDVLLMHLKKMQQDYEKFLAKKGPDAKKLIEEWSNAPNEIKDIYGELFYGAEGLSTFKNPADLPYIRQLAQWAIKYRFKQVCDAALRAFQEMPEKDNLPVIDAIWSEYSVRQWEGNRMSSHEVVEALGTHKYPETVPILAPFLKDSFMGEAAHEALTEIVGKDLGKKPQAWLDWYATQKEKK